MDKRMLAPPSTIRVERRAAILALGASFVLLIIKFLAYYLTGSAAIYSDAMESIVNVIGSGFALYAVILAHRPADSDHPYGHGKIEFLAAGVEGGMIVFAALFIVWEAIQKLVARNKIEQLDTGLVLLTLAMLLNALVGLYLIRKGKTGGSIALESDGKHLLSDAVTSAAALIALVLTRFTHQVWIDPLTAMLMAIYMAATAWGLLRRSAAGLMDEQDAADEDMIKQILDSHLAPSGKEPQICSYHKLRHRHSGRYHWVDFHIMVPARWDIERGHKTASAIEYEIELAIGEGNATAHVEPCHDSDCARCGSPSAATIIKN